MRAITMTDLRHLGATHIFDDCVNQLRQRRGRYFTRFRYGPGVLCFYVFRVLLSD